MVDRDEAGVVVQPRTGAGDLVAVRAAGERQRGGRAGYDGVEGFLVVVAAQTPDELGAVGDRNAAAAACASRNLGQRPVQRAARTALVADGQVVAVALAHAERELEAILRRHRDDRSRGRGHGEGVAAFRRVLERLRPRPGNGLAGDHRGGGIGVLGRRRAGGVAALQADARIGAAVGGGRGIEGDIDVVEDDGTILAEQQLHFARVVAAVGSGGVAVPMVATPLDHRRAVRLRAQHLPADAALRVVEVGPERNERRTAQLAVAGGGGGGQHDRRIADVAGGGVEQHGTVVAYAQPVVADAEERDVERQRDVGDTVIGAALGAEDRCAGSGNVRVVVRRIRIGDIAGRAAGGLVGRPGGIRRERARFRRDEDVVEVDGLARRHRGPGIVEQGAQLGIDQGVVVQRVGAVVGQRVAHVDLGVGRHRDGSLRAALVRIAVVHGHRDLQFQRRGRGHFIAGDGDVGHVGTVDRAAARACLDLTFQPVRLRGDGHGVGRLIFQFLVEQEGGCARSHRQRGAAVECQAQAIGGEPVDRPAHRVGRRRHHDAGDGDVGHVRAVDGAAARARFDLARKPCRLRGDRHGVGRLVFQFLAEHEGGRARSHRQRGAAVERQAQAIGAEAADRAAHGVGRCPRSAGVRGGGGVARSRSASHEVLRVVVGVGATAVEAEQRIGGAAESRCGRGFRTGGQEGAYQIHDGRARRAGTGEGRVVVDQGEFAAVRVGAADEVDAHDMVGRRQHCAVRGTAVAADEEVLAGLDHRVGGEGLADATAPVAGAVVGGVLQGPAADVHRRCAAVEQFEVVVLIGRTALIAAAEDLADDDPALRAIGGEGHRHRAILRDRVRGVVRNRAAHRAGIAGDGIDVIARVRRDGEAGRVAGIHLLRRGRDIAVAAAHRRRDGERLDAEFGMDRAGADDGLGDELVAHDGAFAAFHRNEVMARIRHDVEGQHVFVSRCHQVGVSDLGERAAGAGGDVDVEAAAFGRHREARRLVVAGGGAREGAIAHATAGEGVPDDALVGEIAGIGGNHRRVGRKDAVARFHELRVAALHLLAVDHQLQRQAVAATTAVNVRLVAVAVGELAGHVPQHRGPDRAHAMRHGVGLIGHIRVRERVDAHVRRVAVTADAGAVGALEGRVGADAAWHFAHGVGHGQHEAEEIAPAFALLLVAGKAILVARAGEAVADAVAVFVRDDARIEIAVAVGEEGTLELDRGGLRQDRLAHRFAIGVTDGDDRNRDRAALHARAHTDRLVAVDRIVVDHHRCRAALLRTLGLGTELAGAANDEDNLARHVNRRGGAAAFERIGAGASNAVGQHDFIGVAGRITGAAPACGQRGVVGLVRRQHAQGRGCRPAEHLHARRLPIDGRGEVSVVDAGRGGLRAVQRIGDHAVVLVVAGAADTATIVIDLEVAGDFIEAVVVHHVMDDVVPVEQVDRGRDAVAGAVRGLVFVPREIQRQRVGARVVRALRAVGGADGGVVAVEIPLGAHVVALRADVLGRRARGGGVGVVPAVGRGERARGRGDHIVGVGDQHVARHRVARMGRAFMAKRENPVLLVVGGNLRADLARLAGGMAAVAIELLHVVFADHLFASDGVVAQVEVFGFLDMAIHGELPGQAQFVAVRLVHQLRLDIFGGQRTAGERGLRGARNLHGAEAGFAQIGGGLFYRLRRREAGRGDVGRGVRVREEAGGGKQHFTAVQHVDLEHALVDGNAVHKLVEEHMRHAVVVGDVGGFVRCQFGDVSANQTMFAVGRKDVLLGDPLRRSARGDGGLGHYRFGGGDASSEGIRCGGNERYHRIGRRAGSHSVGPGSRVGVEWRGQAGSDRQGQGTGHRRKPALTEGCGGGKAASACGSRCLGWLEQVLFHGAALG